MNYHDMKPLSLDIEIPDDVSFPGEHEAEMNDSLLSINANIDQMKKAAGQESKKNRSRFVITTILSAIAAVAAVGSLILSIIP